jgi:hypothetical protein
MGHVQAGAEEPEAVSGDGIPARRRVPVPA